MTSNLAWKRHGCYTLGSEQYFNMPLEKPLLGCYDDWNALDHFDPTTDTRRLMARFHHLRGVYGSLQDGFNLVQRGNWKYRIERPGSNHTQTEMGLWSVSRSGLPNQPLNGTFNDQVWLLYTNENSTKTWSFDCKQDLWISSPFQSGVVVRNLFPPYETYNLQESLSSFFNDSKAPFFGCLQQVTMDPYGFKALVPVEQWATQPPSITKFTPGHDHRILANAGDPNATAVDISIGFNIPMDCDGVIKSISFNVSSSGKGGKPTISNVKCNAVANPDPVKIVGVDTSTWTWAGTVTGLPDGVLTVTVNNAPTQGGNATTGVSPISLFSGDPT